MATYADVITGHANLVAYWPLQEAAGTVATDAAAGTYPGTYSGSYTLARPGHVQVNAPLFAGGRVTVADAAALDGFAAITVEGWVCLDDAGATIAIVDKNTSSSYALYIVSGRPYVYMFGLARSVAPNVLAPGMWHHVACTWSGTSTPIRLYVNGLLINSSSAQTGPVGTDTSDVKIGNGAGRIEQVALYNADIGAAEIAAHTLYGWRERAHRVRLQEPSAVAPRLDFAPTSWPGSQLRANLQEVQLNIFRPGTQINSDIVRH